MAYVSHPILLLLFPLITISLPISLSQPLPNASCNGIFISYNYSSGFPIPPNLLPTNPTRQPYRFQSTLSILNNGLEELKSWRVRVVYGHGEYLVSAPGAVLADGTSLPADVSNGTVLAGETMPDLKSAAQTAGDWNQMQVRIELVGTQYGVGAPDVPLPSSLSLANDGFSCPAPMKIGNNMLQLCCNKDSNFQSNTTSYTDFSPLQTGDLTIMYDVTKSYDSNYWAQVTISNNSPLARLDNWLLSWDWTRDEFIHSMKGAYPHIVDSTDCIYGRQGQYYKDLDFSTVLNCDRRPTIIDLPLTKTNDTNLGLIPFCCRDGVILPTFIDRSKSKSVFIMEVYKMPPDLNRTQLFSPQNFRINGTKMNPNYQCGPPAKVSPTLFPDPSGLLSESTAVASWQVVCNLTKLEEPKCCVSFSAFFNDSVVPCNTCACGCKNQSMNTCNTTSSALLLPYEALLVPSENRTKMAKDFRKTKKWDLPNPLPCEDNCGVSINWHLLTDYRGGWTARMTIFNWGETNFADWFSAVELDKAMPGFEAVYSFNGTTNSDSKNTIFLQGLSGLNYLLAKRDSENPSKNPPVPGSAQSVISFTKKNTPGINAANGDGFPTKVYFNGEECSLPLKLPTGNGHKIGMATVFRTFIFIILMFL